MGRVTARCGRGSDTTESEPPGFGFFALCGKTIFLPLTVKANPKAHDGKITTERVDDTWGTDMTSAITTTEGQAAILFAVDHCSMECVGIHAAKRGTRFEALEPIRQGVRECFGAFGKDVAAELTLRHDHLSACNAQADGSQYMSDVFQEEISFLGITSSPAFVREP